MIDNACKILEYMCDVIAALKLSAENEDGARFRSSSPTGDGSGKGGFFQGIIVRYSRIFNITHNLLVKYPQNISICGEYSQA